MIVLLHGYTGSGALQNLYMNIHQLARFNGYVLMYPDGLVDNWNQRYWSATDSCCDFAPSNNDDAGYIKGLIEEVSTKVNID